MQSWVNRGGWGESQDAIYVESPPKRSGLNGESCLTNLGVFMSTRECMLISDAAKVILMRDAQRAIIIS